MMRPLYLLALLQLVGGPLVLLPFILLGKVAVTCARESEPKAGLAKVCEIQTWKTAIESTFKLHADAPKESSPGEPIKIKSTQEKFLAVAWKHQGHLLPLRLLPQAVPVYDRQFTNAWPQAPPVPPPRRVHLCA